jgi:hypothetical protein
MHLSPNAVARAMRTKNSGVQDRSARSARYTECANVVCFDLDSRESGNDVMPAQAGTQGEEGAGFSHARAKTPLCGVALDSQKSERQGKLQGEVTPPLL